MSNTKEVKKLIEIQNNLSNLNNIVSSRSSYKTLFKSHTSNTNQDFFETHHQVTLNNAAVQYTPSDGNNNSNLGIELILNNNIGDSALIRSKFRFPYIGQKTNIYFSHYYNLTIVNTTIEQLILETPGSTPTLGQNGFGFIWEYPLPNITLRLATGGGTLIDSTNFNIDKLDGTGPSGINLTDLVPTPSAPNVRVTTFILLDQYTKCMQFGIRCGDNDFMVHELVRLNNDVQFEISGELFFYFVNNGTVSRRVFFRTWEILSKNELNDCILDSKGPFLHNISENVTSSSSDTLLIMRYNNDGITPDPSGLGVKNIYPDKLDIYGCGLFLLKIYFSSAVTSGNESTANVSTVLSNSQVQLLSDILTIPVPNSTDNIVYSIIINDFINLDLKKILYWYHFAFLDIVNDISTEVRFEITNLDNVDNNYNLSIIWREI